ncbi:SET domain protein [compost metagenome]
MDDSRFMNHSNHSNVGYDQNNESCYALRDINAGEELTIVYNTFCEEDFDYSTYI